jgi:hypothetical protein
MVSDTSDAQLVAFWHIGLSTARLSKPCYVRDAIIEEQYRTILASPMYRKRMMQVHFVTPELCHPQKKAATAQQPVCTPPPNLLQRIASTPRFRHVRRPPMLSCADGNYVEHFEIPTLLRLHQFCRVSLCLSAGCPVLEPPVVVRWLLAGPLLEPRGRRIETLATTGGHSTATVAYMHTKAEDSWRRSMMEAVFGMSGEVDCMQHCFGSKPKAVACGARYQQARRGPVLLADTDFSRAPNQTSVRHYACPAPAASWCHYMGNFWWARCSHISRLNQPLSAGVYDTAEPTSRVASSASSDLTAWEQSLFEVRKAARDVNDVRPWRRYFAEWWLLNDVDHSLSGLAWPPPYDVLVDDAPHAPLAREPAATTRLSSPSHAPIARTAQLFAHRETRYADGVCTHHLTSAGRRYQQARHAADANNITYPAFCPAAELGLVCESTPRHLPGSDYIDPDAAPPSHPRHALLLAALAAAAVLVMGRVVLWKRR